jgi:hypothetical protein
MHHDIHPRGAHHREQRFAAHIAHAHLDIGGCILRGNTPDANNTHVGL